MKPSVDGRSLPFAPNAETRAAIEASKGGETVRFVSVEAFLDDLKAIDVEPVEQFSFGDSPAMADALLGLVLDGRKTATCWSVKDGLDAVPGHCASVLDGKGRPRAVVRTLRVEQRRFCDVDAAFAKAEGEGDLSLEWWREAHRRYFERNGGFSPEMLLWCEHFVLVERLPEGQAE